MECYGLQAKIIRSKTGAQRRTDQLSLRRRLESRDDFEENLKRWVGALLGRREEIGA